MENEPGASRSYALAGIDLFVVGGSAGGLSPLLTLLRDLPGTLNAALCVAIHSSPSGPGLLPKIISANGSLPCSYAQDGEPLIAGRIYCAPLDRHLLISGDRLQLTYGPRENGFRPAIDPLFRTAANSFGPRAAGIIFSGLQGDGAHGLALIKRAGGVTIVQDPDEALAPSMPLTALQCGEIDHVIAAAKMGSLVVQLANGASSRVLPMQGAAPTSDDPAEKGADLSAESPPGDLTPFTCPECGGTLWESEEAGQLRFRCHVGHAFSPESLLQGNSREVETALWTALRVLEEHSALLDRLAARCEEQRLKFSSEHFRERAEHAKRQAELLRNALVVQPT